MQKNKLFILAGAILLISALTLAAYFLSKPQPQKYKGPVEKITLAAYAGSYGFLPFIAQEQGYFAENGLEVAITEYDFGLKAADALVAGKADIATAADFVLTSYSFEHDDIRAFAIIASSLTDEIIVRKDRGIEKPADLKGKVVGVSPKTKAEYFLARFLTFNKIALGDIRLAYLEPMRLVEAISRGDIDAVSVWEPFAGEIKKRLGAKAVSWQAQADQVFYYLLLSKASWIKEHPEALERFLRAMIQAEEFVERNPQEAQEFISRRFNYDIQFVRSIWTKNDFSVQLTQALLLQMEDGARWRIKHKLTGAKTDIPNYLNFIYIDGLEKVKPEAVTIIH